MQSAPPESSYNATSVEISPSHTPSSNHGLQDRPDLASGRPSAGDRELPEPVLLPDDSDALSVSSGSTSRGRRSDVRGLKGRDDSSHSSSPGSRIDEYERMHAKRSRRKDGMVFQVVQNSKDKENGIAIEEFPNGTF